MHQLLFNYWEALTSVRTLQVRGWQGYGGGQVITTQTHSRSLILIEKGILLTKANSPIHFNNTLHWTLHSSMIALEHLRRGPNHPIFLCYLVPDNQGLLRSQHPHLCNHDIYSLQIKMTQQGLHLSWHIIGPKKNGVIEILYLTRVRD